MKYHSGTRFNLPEEEQSFIYWLCRNIERIPEGQKKIIKRLIKECAKGQEEALHEALCTKKSLTAVAMKYYITETAIQRRCEDFYKRAAEEFFHKKKMCDKRTR